MANTGAIGQIFKIFVGFFCILLYIVMPCLSPFEKIRNPPTLNYGNFN